MVDDNPLPTWLGEPSISDDSYANEGEHPLDWLARSTLPRAQGCRRFLNENIAALPATAQPKVRADLRERWQSAFFELIVARCLQELGASITLEAQNPDDQFRPDFTAQFPDAPVIVEAVAPMFNIVVSMEEIRQRPLRAIVNALIPDGWEVLVWELPNIGLGDSKKQFRAAVTRLLALPPPTDRAMNLEVAQTLPTGTIRLLLVPRRLTAHSKPRQVAGGPPIAWMGDEKQRIRAAIRHKKSQVRRAAAPVLLAIDASDTGSFPLENFDQALFGYTVGHGASIETRFIPDGEFTMRLNNTKPPTYAGVLAFLEAGFAGVSLPILYLHPRSRAKLPSALLQLEQRIYDPVEQRIRSQAATLRDDALAALRFKIDIPTS